MNKTSIYESKVINLPEEPGCYIWKDLNGNILYIGKAVNLKKRASSYFLNYERNDPKIKIMVDQIADIEYLTVDSEIEALILETNLIKKYKPKYNKLMKDDKNYSWVMIDWSNPYPSVRIVRDQQNINSEYYGPYPKRFPVMKVLKRLRKIFPYCNNLPKDINNKDYTYKNEKVELKPCFDYHINLCSGICAWKISKEEHRRNINGVRQFFKGKKDKTLEKMNIEMAKEVNKRNFENAAILRDRIVDLEYVTQHIKLGKDIDEEKLKKLKMSTRERALEDFLSRINYKNMTDIENIKPKFKIECYDISNFQGTNATGSMVVFIDGKADTNLYRKFKIRSKETPDDFGMMREILIRRLKRIKTKSDTKKGKIVDQSFYIKPDLIIVDGGKGQLSSAHQILKEMGFLDKIELVGLAKREEEIFKIPEEPDQIKGVIMDSNYIKYRLPRRSESLYLVQRIRDEAHRFAIGYHRTLRSHGQVRSVLDDIPGIGKVTKEKLLKAFGSLTGIKKAKREDIEAIIKNKNTVDSLVKILRI